MKEEPTGWSPGVDAVGEAAKVYLARFERIDQIDEPFDASPETVEFPHHQCVTRTQMRERIVQPRSVEARAADNRRDSGLALLRDVRATGCLPVSLRVLASLVHVLTASGAGLALLALLAAAHADWRA